MDHSVGPSATTAVPQDGGSLTHSQMSILIILERTGAGLSMVAIALTVLTYIAFPKMRTTPNLFLLCASGANAAACCASMIGYDGMHAGLESGLCQAQAFIFQWYVPETRFLGDRVSDCSKGSCSRTHGGLSPWQSTYTLFSSSTRTHPLSANTSGYTASYALVALSSPPSR
jgi:hypothetical protein